MTSRRALIGLGSNLGDRRENLRYALEALQRHPDVELLAVSGFHEYPAEGCAAGSGVFLNACALLRTSLGVGGLGRLLDGLEKERGRAEDRLRGDGARRLDLDLLYLGSLVTEEDGYTVPHPRLRRRAFVLEPACEIAPNFTDPRDGRPLRSLRDELRAFAIGCRSTSSAG